MNLLDDPLLFHAAWICLLVGAAVMALAVRDSRFGDTNVVRGAAICLLALGVVFGLADVYVSLTPASAIW